MPRTKRPKRQTHPISVEQFARACADDALGALDDYVLLTSTPVLDGFARRSDDILSELIEQVYRREVGSQRVAPGEEAASRELAAVQVGYRIGVGVMRHVLTGGAR
jgi:hypothetical protein